MPCEDSYGSEDCLVLDASVQLPHTVQAVWKKVKCKLRAADSVACQHALVAPTPVPDPMLQCDRGEGWVPSPSIGSVESGGSVGSNYRDIKVLQYLIPIHQYTHTYTHPYIPPPPIHLVLGLCAPLPLSCTRTLSPPLHPHTLSTPAPTHSLHPCTHTLSPRDSLDVGRAWSHHLVHQTGTRRSRFVQASRLVCPQ
jgi:hypothetical protein